MYSSLCFFFFFKQKTAYEMRISDWSSDVCASDLLSLEEKIDTSSAAGELIFHVFGAIAHFERRLISERTKDGIAAARARGKLPGRQPLDMSKVHAAIKLVEASISPTEAARQLGIGRSTIYREMRRLGVERPA